MKKKIGLIILLLMASLAVVGFGTNSVTLLHKSKVIDLSKAIEVARPGGDEGAQSDINVEDNAAPNESEMAEKSEAEVIVPSNIKIIVYGKTIKFDGKPLEDIDAVEDNIRRTFRTDITYNLIDEYAEAHTYREVIATLDRLQGEIGLKYTKE